MRYLLWILLVAGMLLSAAAFGQPGEPPLNGPLVAFDTAAQDQAVLLEVETGRQRSLSFGPYAHRVWGFSPDGCRLLLTLSEGNGPARILTARLDGGDLREVFTPGTDEGAWDPSFSPDGRQIVFTLSKPESGFEATGGHSHRIALADATSGVVTIVSVSGDEHTPRWSPDGTQIAYTSYETDELGVRAADLWLASAGGSGRTRLTDFPAGSVTMPRWSPDGDLIGFIYSAEANRDTVWMIGAVAGALPTQLNFAPALALDLAWLPSGTAMLAVLRDFRGEVPNRVWQIPLTGVADYDAVLYPPTANLAYPDYPRFSSESDRLALRTTYALSLLALPGGQGGPLPGVEGNTPAVWSPAGFTGEAQCPA
ncbi:MAG: PD40 domain-containing protein [Anaerolineae bacterium]|nr:PD40 domain-containing protein [Anaerolineae bacterium]